MEEPQKKLEELRAMDVEESTLNSDESSDLGSSDEDEKEDEKLELLITELQSKISANVYDYNSHVALIQACGQSGNLDKLRIAREQMSKHFPLTPELWISWLEDETKLSTSEDDSEKLFSLFERAVDDYLSVDLWVEYIQFSMGRMGSENGEEKVRSIIERGLTAGGLHVAKGVLLWEAYREFELALLSILEQQALHSESPQIQEAVLSQKRKIGSIFQRQLAVPLIEMEKTYSEFKLWLNNQEDKNIVDVKVVEHGYKKALLKLSRILAYEEAVLCAEPVSRLGVYQEYLVYEKNPSKGGNDPGRVQCLYERVVTDHCLESQLWVDYINYAINTIKMKEVILKILLRATRNCPWHAEIWLLYIRQLEHFEEPLEKVTVALEQALTAGFSSSSDYRSVWFEYIVYLRRMYSNYINDANKDPDKLESFEEKIRTTIERAYEHLVQLFGTEGDPNCDLLIFWAKWEAVKPNKSMEKVRKIYNDILSISKSTSSLWLQCLAIERHYGDDKHLRRLFARALSADTDWPEGIATTWLDYEKLEGNLETYENCLLKITERLKQVKFKQEKQAKQAAVIEAKNKSSQERHKKGKKGDRSDQAQQGKKPEEASTSASKGQWEHLNAKRAHDSDSSKDNVFKVPKTDEPPEKKLKLEDFGAVAEHDPQKDSRTVFISNLDYSVTEDELKSCINALGFPSQEIRLVKDYKGRSKGYCYVVLESELEAQQLLNKDRERINGRPMFISSCLVDKMNRPKVFRFSTDLEKRKLFVKGIPATFTEEELTTTFKSFGNLKDVRVVTYRNGHSKGIAYVEYLDEDSAKTALLKADGMELGGQPISVAFSKPPERRNQTSLIPTTSSDPLVKSLGGGTKSTGSNTSRRNRTSIMLPRSLQIGSSNSNSSINSSINGNDESASSSTTNGNGVDKASMSNNDFRNMLLGKK